MILPQRASLAGAGSHMVILVYIYVGDQAGRWRWGDMFCPLSRRWDFGGSLQEFVVETVGLERDEMHPNMEGKLSINVDKLQSGGGKGARD